LLIEGTETSISKRIEQIIRETHKYTMLLRRSKDKTYLNFINNVPSTTPSFSKNKADGNDPFLYIKNLRMKRFTEAFYMIYRNMHFIERIPLGFPSGKPDRLTTTEEIIDQTSASVEKHIKPILDSIGYNQSIYLL
jgi:hypothetical protein